MFICFVSESVFTAYLNFCRGDVPFFERKKLYTSWYFYSWFRVINSSGVFSLSVSGKAWFLPAVQTIDTFANFIRLI